MFGTPKTVIGLDVGSYAVKAVALQPNRDRLTLQGYAQERIGTQEPVDVIKKVLEQLGVRSRRLVTAVSGRSVIVRQVETPRLPNDELRAHISYEADKYIPFGSEEVILDCQPLPDTGDAKVANMQVLLVAVRRGFVEDHITMLRNAGVLPEVIDVDVFALSNAYELVGPGLAAPGEGKSATALIDIGASKSNIAIVMGSRLLFTREVYLAGNEITDAIVRTFNEPAEDVERIKAAPGETLEALIDAAMPAFEDIANEIRLSFDYVEGQFDAQVTSVVLTGGSSQLPGIADILGNILGRAVHVLDPLAGLDLVPSRYDVHGLDANGPTLTIALGLAAHVLNFSQTGLGGANSLNWQPRQTRAGGAGGTEHAGAAARSEPAPAPIPNTGRHEPSKAVPVVAPAAPLEPPMTFQPPPEPLMPPPAALPVAHAHEAADEIDAALPDDSPAEAFSLNPDNRRSGLLVVLDEDQEMPPSERHERGTVSGTRKSSQVLKVESFEEDDDLPKDKTDNLPELPRL